MITIAIDPSGNFEEGKGHTGVACILNEDPKTFATKSISAKAYDDRCTYWQEVLNCIKNVYEGGQKLQVVIESYVMRANGFTIGKMPETAMLIGVLVFYCEQHNIPYYIQQPSQAKARFKDELLLKYIPDLELRETGKYYLRGRLTNDHERDALKHLLFFKKYKEFKV